MINKQAEINYRYRLYNACRGMLRIKRAFSDRELHAVEEAGRTAGDRDADYLRSLGGRGADAVNGARDNYYGGIEGFGERVGDYGRRGLEAAGRGMVNAGRNIRNGVVNAGRGIAAGARAASNYANRAAHGAYDGMKNFGSGLMRHTADQGHFAIDHPLAAAAGLGVGYLGGKAGYHGADWLAGQMGLEENSGWRKAIKWGGGALAGLASGLAGMHFAHGIGKGLRGSRRPAPVAPRSTMTPDTDPEVDASVYEPSDRMDD